MPGRLGNSADSYLKVHDRSAHHADVTEGSGGVWERLHYDWSNLDRVVMRTTDSNVPERTLFVAGQRREPGQNL